MMSPINKATTCGLGAALALAALLSAPVSAQDRAIEDGRAIAEARCARCHAIGTSGASPLVKAPPFRMLHRRYPVEDLAEALAEGIMTGHPEMPQVVLDPPQIEAFIAFLNALNETD